MKLAQVIEEMKSWAEDEYATPAGRRIAKWVVAIEASPSSPIPEGMVLVDKAVLDRAANIYDLMLRCSRSCRPMEHLLTTDGLYHLNIANLHVRSDGKEYVMEADWAKLCGKLVKELTERRAMLAASGEKV